MRHTDVSQLDNRNKKQDTFQNKNIHRATFAASRPVDIFSNLRNCLFNFLLRKLNYLDVNVLKE